MEEIGTGLQLRSLITGDGLLKLSLDEVAIPEPAADEIVVRVLASPINPSDLGLLLGAADMTTARTTGEGRDIMVTATVPQAMMRAMAGRVGEPMPVGNEGAGVVVKAGTSAAAQALLGKGVAMIGGAMYAQYRCIKVADCLVLPADATPADGASAFVNPLTALGMVETMRREGHTALVHTAAASNLGQMLNRICLKDGIGLVNIVRSDDQAALLRGIGAAHVCNSGSATFMEDPVGLRERHHIGIDNIMWASDYPHSETTWPNSKALTDEWFTPLGEDDKRKVLWENAARLYDLI